VDQRRWQHDDSDQDREGDPLQRAANTGHDVLQVLAIGIRRIGNVSCTVSTFA
jgi:hypothetical protein